MQRLLEQHPHSKQLRAICNDEISILKGNSYTIVVADLNQKRPIWVGGQNRSEQDLQRFFDSIGSECCNTIELAVMDMWKPFRKAMLKNAPNAQIVYDKFHIMRHLAKALD